MTNSERQAEFAAAVDNEMQALIGEYLTALHARARAYAADDDEPVEVAREVGKPLFKTLLTRVNAHAKRLGLGPLSDQAKTRVRSLLKANQCGSQIERPNAELTSRLLYGLASGLGGVLFCFVFGRYVRHVNACEYFTSMCLTVGVAFGVISGVWRYDPYDSDSLSSLFRIGCVNVAATRASFICNAAAEAQAFPQRCLAARNVIIADCHADDSQPSATA